MVVAVVAFWASEEFDKRLFFLPSVCPEGEKAFHPPCLANDGPVHKQGLHHHHDFRRHHHHALIRAQQGPSWPRACDGPIWFAPVHSWLLRRRILKQHWPEGSNIRRTTTLYCTLVSPSPIACGVQFALIPPYNQNHKAIYLPYSAYPHQR